MTINLNKGLEALYYFDEQNFDSQRNVIRDHSGYGRHADANGGPTIGVNGPNGFRATGFDGSDDGFNAGPYIGLDKISVAVLFKSDVKNADGNGNTLVYIGSSPDNINQFGDNLRFTYRRKSDDKIQSLNTGSTIDVGEWQTAIFTQDRNKPRVTLEVDGNTAVQSKASNHSSAPIREVGNGRYAPWDGDIAFAAGWSRILSPAEKEFLKNITAPRRAQL